MGLPVRLALALLLAVGLNACAAPAGESSAEDGATVTGNVRLPAGVLLQAGDRIEVRLEDVSRADAAAKTLAETMITGVTGNSAPFRLSFSESAVDPRNSYAVRARIERDGNLAYISDTHTPVLTRGASRQADIAVVAVGRAAEPGIPLEGMFRYLADAAQFRDCRTGQTFPVAMEGAYIELERAYLNSRINAGSEVMVHLRGRYLSRPGMENKTQEINLIVDSFKKLEPDLTCAPTEHADLRNTYWKLVEIGDETVRTADGQREAHFVLSLGGDEVRGHGGCNRFSGGYRLDGGAIRFSALGSTRMACPAGMKTERAFLESLARADHYQVSGQFLTLFEGDMPLARFEAVYF